MWGVLFGAIFFGGELSWGELFLGRYILFPVSCLNERRASG